MEPRAGDLAAARRYLPRADDASVRVFASRQLEARVRLTRLLDFYRRNPSRVARIHILTALAVTLGRFCGLSVSFDAIGEALSPVGSDGRPRGEGWTRYQEACAARRPLEVRDELWMTAHLGDMERVRDDGLLQSFEAEMEAHRSDPTWLLLEQHMAMTLGARLLDHAALAGAIPYETAIAEGMATAVSRIARAGWRLICRYSTEAVRALLVPEHETGDGLLSYRRAALLLAVYGIYAWTASPVYRRGIRLRDRGLVAEDDAWPLFQRVLGAEVAKVHPAIVRFYENPSRYDVRARLTLHTLPARLWSWAVTLLIGQGLYETPPDAFDARFRVFRRDDGSMHFVRELYLPTKLRVFDSDFVVREVASRQTLFEVFVEHRIEVQMEVDVLEGGAVRIRGRRVTAHGLPIPRFGLNVQFESRVDGDEISIDGKLLLQPETALGRFIAHRLLRRPEELGAIAYRLGASPAVPDNRVS